MQCNNAMQGSIKKVNGKNDMIFENYLLLSFQQCSTTLCVL